MDRDLKACIYSRVVSHAGASGDAQRCDQTRAWEEVPVGIFRVDPALDGMPRLFHILLSDGELLPGRQPYLLLDDVDTRDHLRDRMLHLEPRIHLEKVEISAPIDKELARSHALVTHRARRLDGHSPHRRADFGGNDHRRGFFDHLLVAPLNGTFPFAQVDIVAVPIPQDLDFHVACAFDVLFNVHGVVVKGGFRLGSGHPKG